MQRVGSRLSEQLWERWRSFLSRLQEDPTVTKLMSSRMGQYLLSHPFVALTLLLFSVMAALPVGVFLTVAVVTIVTLAVGSVLFVGMVLLVGGLTLLSVLGGIAVFSFLVSVVIGGVFITIPGLLGYNQRLPEKGDGNTEKVIEGETSG